VRGCRYERSLCRDDLELDEARSGQRLQMILGRKGVPRFGRISVNDFYVIIRES
jgi:hypothetical protein